MQIIKQIKKEDIKKRVMSEINKSKKEILATMDIIEESNSPLPIEYFYLLKRKSRNGVKIKRIVFGSKKQYKLFLNKIKVKNLFFTGNHTKSKNYKRMIIVDGVKLFFRNKIGFYFTTDDKYIKEYKTYFNKFK